MYREDIVHFYDTRDLKPRLFADVRCLLRRALQNSPGEPTKYLIALTRACRAVGDDKCARQSLGRLRELDPHRREVEALVSESGTVVNQATA
jgi:hypothetical protein